MKESVSLHVVMKVSMDEHKEGRVVMTRTYVLFTNKYNHILCKHAEGRHLLRLRERCRSPVETTQLPASSNPVALKTTSVNRSQGVLLGYTEHEHEQAHNAALLISDHNLASQLNLLFYNKSAK